jgi:diguanylate cyclase
MYANNEIPYNYYNKTLASKAFTLITENKGIVIDAFYKKLLENPKTSEFLTHEDIESRLKSSFQGWVITTFDYEKFQEDSDSFYKYQDNIGRVHSRVNIGLHLINYAKVILKRCLFELDKSNTEYLCYVSDVVDYAVDSFNQSYLKEIIETTRHRQSLRVVASGHQLALDFERAKGEVTSWIMEKLWSVTQQQIQPTKRVTDLSFYHWLKHKGSFSFSDDAVRKSLINSLEDLNEIESLITEHRKKSDSVAHTASIQGLLGSAIHITEDIHRELDKTIQYVLEAEERKDALTKTLSRRFLPAVTQKEVLFAKHTGTPFSVLMLDVDNFKTINDTYGHRTGDEVLEEMAQVLMERLRPGDYVFRYGGEEFLVLISEATIEMATHIAEEIRLLVSEKVLKDSDRKSIHFTISIGVAEYDFHPDFMRTISLADKRLLVAKNEGKNRVISSGS